MTGAAITSIEMTVTHADGTESKVLVTEGSDMAWGAGREYLAETLDIRASVQDTMTGEWGES